MPTAATVAEISFYRGLHCLITQPGLAVHLRARLPLPAAAADQVVQVQHLILAPVLLPARSLARPQSQLLLYSVSDFFLFFFFSLGLSVVVVGTHSAAARAQESRSLLAGSSFPPSLPHFQFVIQRL